MAFLSGSSAAMTCELELTAQRLRGCSQCGCPHPLALGKPDGNCPNCDHPSAAPDQTRIVPAHVGGFWGVIARMCFSIAKLLSRLVEKLS